MPTETKNSTANASCSGRESAAALCPKRDLAEHDAGKEGPQRERDAEQRRRAVGDAQRHRQHGQGEQLARARSAPPGPAATAPRAGRAPAPTPTNSPTLPRVRATVSARLPPPPGPPRPLRMLGDRRQQHESQHHHQILDDQPADGDTAIDALERHCAPPSARSRTTVLATDRRQAQHQPGPQAPAPDHRHDRARSPDDADLRHRAGNGDPAHRRPDRRSRNAGRPRTSAG